MLVDDGSPDQCPAICDEYAAKDSRVKVIHQPNGGLSAARNAALDWIFTYSDSQWVFFLDSDDWLHPVTLECMLDANQNSIQTYASAAMRKLQEPILKSILPI